MPYLGGTNCIIPDHAGLGAPNLTWQMFFTDQDFHSSPEQAFGKSHLTFRNFLPCGSESALFQQWQYQERLPLLWGLTFLNYSFRSNSSNHTHDMEGTLSIQCADIVSTLIYTGQILLSSWECQFHMTKLIPLNFYT